MTQRTISVAKAAEALQTNSNVIETWVKERKIPAILTPDGWQIPTQPFEQLCTDLKDWLSDETPNEGGAVGRTIADLDDFWRTRNDSSQTTL